MFDIDAIKRYSAELKSSNDYAERIFDSMVRPLVVLDAELRVQHANPTFYETFNTTPNEANATLCSNTSTVNSTRRSFKPPSRA
jgi:two-component system CheB/CheR fusion protein